MRRLLVLFGFSLVLFVPRQSAAQVRELPLRDGDRLLVKIWIDSLFGDTARVQHGGTVMLPRFGTLSIANLAPSQIPDSVRRAYGERIREATIEVTPLRKVTILGEVRRPAVYYLDPLFSVRDAIAMAGGINDIGVSGRVTIVRDSGTTRMKGWQERQGEDAALRSGDIILVDRESWFKRNAFTAVSGTSVLLSIILTLRKQ